MTGPIIESLNSHLNIVEPYDALIVSDGSGTGHGNACGWCAVLIDAESRLRKIVKGASSDGTCYLAELLPYVNMLAWYTNGPGKALLTKKRQLFLNAKLVIHAVTDNQTIARQGRGEIGRKTGRAYWAMLEAFEDDLDVRWHWIDRAQVGLNCLCDFLAGECRKAIKAVDGCQLPSGLTAYDYNPEKPR